MTPTRLNSLLLVNGNLVWHGGHAYPETIGWVDLARRNHVALEILAASHAHPELIAELGARPRLGATARDVARYMTPEQFDAGHAPELSGLTHFLMKTRATAQACATIWAEAVQRPELIVLAWADPAEVNGAAEWFADMAAADRPKVVVNLAYDAAWRGDPARTRIEADFSLLRLAARRLRALCQPEDLLFTATDPRLARMLAQVTEGPCLQTPNHAFYPDDATLASLRERRPPASTTIGLLGAQRDEKGRALIADVVDGVSRVAPEVRFFVQARDPDQAREIAGSLADRACCGQVDLMPGPLPLLAYFERVLACDLILLPYRPEDYAFRSSGIFCDAVACEIPIVAPQATWMGDRLAEGWGAGTTFERAEPDLVVGAVLGALKQLPALAGRAAGQGPAWREAHSLEAYWRALLSALSLTCADTDAPLLN